MGYAAGLIGAIFCGFIGLVVGLITAHFSIPKNVGFIRFLLGMLGTGLVGCVLGVVAGVVIEVAVIDAVLQKRRANDPQEQFAAAIKAIPLKVALCDHQNAEEAKSILANPLDAKTPKFLDYIILNCTHSAQSKELIPQMLIYLHADYLAGNSGNSGNERGRRSSFSTGEKKDESELYGYCHVLHTYINARNIAALREMLSLKLPLHCAGKAQQLRLGGQMFTQVKPEQEEKVVELIQLLHSAGTPFNEIRSAAGESILDKVIDYAPPSVIKAFLAAGIDPGYPAGYALHGRIHPAAVLTWVVRKHLKCAECKVISGRALSAEEIADIDGIMREPTAEEINLQGTASPGSILFRIKDFEDQPDGGAAFFRYLKSRGADLGAAWVYSRPPGTAVTPEMQAYRTKGFLAYTKQLSPALRAELEKLTPQEIDQMAHPRVAGSNRFEEPLLDSARRYKNKSLEDFLCVHHVDGCVPMEPEKPPESRKK